MLPVKADGSRTEGGLTDHQPSGEQMPIYEAAMKYGAAGVPTVVFGGEEYGTGSSRDWAAKGTLLLGTRAVIAKSFERIHRANLVMMGVLPFQFMGNDSPDSMPRMSIVSASRGTRLSTSSASSPACIRARKCSW